MTPDDNLCSLPETDTFLKPNIAFEQLDQPADQVCDNKAAQHLDNARNQFFQSIFNRP